MEGSEFWNQDTDSEEECMEELRVCPFCESPVNFMTIMTGLKMFYCKNYKDCGAIVSFDNPVANNSDKAKIECWNRRTNDDGR